MTPSHSFLLFHFFVGGHGGFSVRRSAEREKERAREKERERETERRRDGDRERKTDKNTDNIKQTRRQLIFFETP